jgi:hypothetical protein
LLFAALALSACASGDAPPPLQLRAGVDNGGNCTLGLNGRELSEDELARLLRERGTREVHLTGVDFKVPYRCVGGVIALLQRAKVPTKIGFIAEPPPADTNISENWSIN